MCEDCGCQEGNERAYFSSHETHGHSHAHGHADVHVGSHGHTQSHGAQEIHIHIHLEGAAGVHVHTHSGASSLQEHRAAHSHTHVHEHSDGNLHTHVQVRESVHSHPHTHAGGHQHAHDGADETLISEKKRSKTIKLETNVLAQNDAQAAKNRKWLNAKGVVAVNLISSPGSGKTFLLEKTLDALRGKIPCAVITGDMQTDNDAKRMTGKGAPVVQIETRSACHLNAQQIEERLQSVVAEGVKLLFIENVGNLVCPAAFDLGEQQKIALVSVAEGEDKPLKYPVLFHGAAVTLITKTDLLPHLEVDLDKYKASVKQIQPGAKIIEVSAKTGDGMDEWIEYLKELVKTK